MTTPLSPRAILFGASPSSAGFANDTISLLKYIDTFTSSLGMADVSVDSDKCRNVIIGMHSDFPCIDGLSGASSFKKAANFLTYFVAERPIVTEFPSEALGEGIVKINNHQNALIGLCFVIDALHGASIHSGTDSEDIKILSEKIVLSKHSFIDVVDALASSTPQSHFKVVTVLLEQLAYKSNPDCQYNDVIAW